MKDKEGTELAIGDIVITINPLRRMTIEKMTPTRIAYMGEGYTFDRTKKQYVKISRMKYVAPYNTIKVGHVDKPADLKAQLAPIPE